jgi:hypothetical protein
MGDIAEQLIDEEMFGPEYKDHHFKFSYWKRTPAEKKIASIRKEIALDIKSGTPVGKARQKANIKYGKGWRERGLCVNDEDQWTQEELAPFK